MSTLLVSGEEDERVDVMPPMSDKEVSEHRLKLLEDKLTNVSNRLHDLAGELATEIAQRHADHTELERHRTQCTAKESENRARNWQLWMAVLVCGLGIVASFLKTQPQQPTPVVNVTVPKDSIKVILPTKVVGGGS